MGLIDVDAKDTLGLAIIGIIAVLLALGYLFNWIGEYVDYFKGVGTPLLGVAGIIIIIAVVLFIITVYDKMR